MIRKNKLLRLSADKARTTYSLCKIGAEDFFFDTSSIILYHRVAEANNDPHRLCVSPKIFKDQMKYLRNNFEVISLSSLTDKLTEKSDIKNTVVVTFDDGYYDNLSNALPILREFKIPATIFITAGKIGDNKPFYWDEAGSKDAGRPLREEELAELSGNDLIEIGSHTVSHPKLSAIRKEQAEQEISDSKKIIESIIKKPTDSFSYPFGTKRDFTASAIEAVKKAGYKRACANYPGRVTKRSNIFSLPRIIAPNDTESFAKKFKRQ